MGFSVALTATTASAQSLKAVEEVGVLLEDFLKTPQGVRLLEEIAGSRAGVIVRKQFLGELGLNSSPLADQGRRLLTHPQWSAELVEQARPDQRLLLQGLINDYRSGLPNELGASTRISPNAPFTLCGKDDNCEVLTGKSLKRTFFESAAGGSGKALGAVAVAPLTVPAVQGMNKWCEEVDCASLVSKRIESVLGQIPRAADK
jgi:hypothetical protein